MKASGATQRELSRDILGEANRIPTGYVQIEIAAY